MPPSLPKVKRPSLPQAGGGSIYENAGKYARGAVLYAFENIGGADALADWARENPDDFYTKLFPKIITKEVDVQDNRGVDELLTVLDGDYEVVGGADDLAGEPTEAPPPHPDEGAEQ